MTTPECLFCKVARGEINVKKLFETERVVAFQDIHPQAPTHLLVIPKEHLTNLDDLAEGHGDLASALLLGVQRAAREAGLGGGYRTVANTGPDAGQSVAHLHLHVLGGRRLGWPPG